MKKHHATQRGLGVLAVGSAFLVAGLAILFAAAQSLSQPLAPAIFGGGGSLAALCLGRWGFRSIRA